MWLYLNNSFLSIVAHREKPNHLLVRARVAGDIERVFPSIAVEHTPDADYQYRATVPRELVGKAISDRLVDIDYPNFKDSVREGFRHDHYSEVWSRAYTQLRK